MAEVTYTGATAPGKQSSEMAPARVSAMVSGLNILMPPECVWDGAKNATRALADMPLSKSLEVPHAESLDQRLAETARRKRDAAGIIHNCVELCTALWRAMAHGFAIWRHECPRDEKERRERGRRNAAILLQLRGSLAAPASVVCSAGVAVTSRAGLGPPGALMAGFANVLGP